MKTWKRALRAFSPACIAVIIIFGLVFTGCTDGNEVMKGIAVTGVTLNETSLDLAVDGMATLTATVLPKNATDKTVTWKSGDPAKVTVTVNAITGVATVKGVAEGTADITVTAKNGEKATCVVTVRYAAVRSVTPDQEYLLLGLGGEDQLTATVLPKNADQTVTWSIAPEGFATVTNGKVTAVAVGEATITVTTTGKKADGQPATATCAVEVVPSVPVTGVTLDKSTLKLKVGREPEELTATVSPRNASNKNVTWSSDDEDVATVTDGLVTAVGVGTATITVTTNDGGFPATCDVTATVAMPEIPGLVWIDPGTFWMGSPDGESGRGNDETRHQVTLSQGFYMSESPVMVGEYYMVMDDIPTWFWDVYFEFDDDLVDFFPMDGVNWYGAVYYCNRRSVLEGLTPAYSITDIVWDSSFFDQIESATVTWNENADGYRLPTEAEWEYACRAGTTTAYSTGDTISTITVEDDRITAIGDGNFMNEEEYYLGYPFPVFDWEPNPWGLYGMHGTLEEWCWDLYAADYGGTTGIRIDPKGPSTGSERVVRGGSWADTAEYVRSAARWKYDPADEYEYFFGSPFVGFRVVRNAPGSTSSPKLSINNARTEVRQDRGSPLQPRTEVRQDRGSPLHGIRIGKHSDVSPVRPQALRRKSVLE
jgi:uncharacterized protein YjdB